MYPPDEIDGATVLVWAWSDKPFGHLGAIPIHGLAICRYPESETVYRFSCDKDWETQQDAVYDSVDQARAELPAQYRFAPIVWRERRSSQLPPA